MKSGLIDIQRPVTVCRASAGTGKTYTLAAYYVGLLLSGEDYKSILAITFTNKATAEMSERILTYLYALSQGQEKAFLERARQFMIRNHGASDEQLAQLAGECFRKMLSDFDNMQIQTIDSFLQTLLSGLAGLLHQSAGQNTELDVKQVISRAVDELMRTASDETNSVMEKFILSRLAEESKWNIRNDLCALAKELYNESVQVLDGEDKILFNANAIGKRRERLLQAWKDNPYVPQIRELLSKLETYSIDESYGKEPKNALESLIKYTHDSLERPNKTSDEYVFRGLTDGYLEKAKSVDKWKDVPEPVLDLAIRLTEISRECRRLYFSIHLSVELSHEMQLMSALQEMIMRQLYETNSALLSRTASILCDALRQGDADFILEKAGIRYHHILMDEFQDTSQLQWSVIRQLIMDILAGEGNTLLIVGDIKQSIYRWRNGDWHIMAGLGDEKISGFGYERINEKFTSLTKNFRSSEQVVRFNLSLFQFIMSNYSKLSKNADLIEQKLVEEIYGEGFEDYKLADFYQADKKPGGFVRFKAVPQKDDKGEKVNTVDEILTDMFDQMESLLKQGASPSDMMIVIRKGGQAELITKAHAALDPLQYPALSKASIVSAKSFLLESAESVLLLIDGLRVATQDDDVAANHIIFSTRKPESIGQIKEKIKVNTPLYEAVCELIKILLTDEGGQYKDQETAYVNCLLDKTREYIRSNGSNIEKFLTYWDEILSEKSIPVSSLNAIQILTIHKSKGLQSQTLFVPFCDWKTDESKSSQKIWCPIAEELHEGDDYVPIYNVSPMTDTSYRKAYELEHLNARIDSINMLYVALTRAEDNLFIYTEYTPSTKKGTHVGYYLKDFVETTEYSIGTPVIKNAQKAESDKPFSFEQADKIEAELWANDDQVRFVQSEEGALYTSLGDEAYRRVARMDEGTLCHEIFANIHKADELENVLDEFMCRGEIQDEEQRERLKALISSAWEGSAEMKDWFTAPWKLYLEKAIYIDQRELRPDRVMINPQTNEAIVLDYKFGQPESNYKKQVNEYKEALRRIGYTPVRGYLWYALTNKLEEMKG